MIKITFQMVFAIFISVVSSNIFSRDLPKPALMLANIYHEGINLSEYWVSEKYDGVRAVWDGEQFISRGGNIYHAPEWFTQNLPKQKLDGELWISRQSFELLVSTVRGKTPDTEAWKKVTFMVFDLPELNTPFDDRLKKMQTLIADLKIPWVKMVRQWRVKSHLILMQELKDITTAGAEGLMLHKGSSFYKGKRNGDLLKVKLVEDAEAVVIKHIKGKGKYSQVLGALVVEMPSGKRFRIGSGFSDNERQNPPEVGETVTYQYRGKTKKGIPRFATFLRVRQLEGK